MTSKKFHQVLVILSVAIQLNSMKIKAEVGFKLATRSWNSNFPERYTMCIFILFLIYGFQNCDSSFHKSVEGR